MTRHGRRIKRCGTCVERKVKCDEQQPHCQRCKNAGLTCSGYHSQLKFVDEGTRFISTVTCNSKPVAKPATATKRSRPTTTTTTTSKTLAKHAKTPKSQISYLPPPRDTLFLPYTLSKLSPGMSSGDPMQAAGMLYQLLTVPKSSLHQSCVQALSAMYFGRGNRDRQACQQGLMLYSHALTHLRADISNAATDFSTIMSVVCLCLYENVVFSQPTAWLMHYDGLGRLLQAQGPRPWKTSQERQIFLFARYYITLSAGHQRRHCFLAQPQWELPQCMPEGEESDEMIGLSDIFAHCPGIIADYDELLKTTPVDPVALEALRDRTQAIIVRAHAWFGIVPWICTTDPALRETISLPNDPMNSVALTVAHAMLLCLAQPCDYLQISLTREDNTDVAGTIKFLAREICRIADWALHGHSSADIALILIFPLQIAWFCLRDSKEDLCSIRGIMNSNVADSHGFEIGRMRHWDPSSLGQGRVGFLY